MTIQVHQSYTVNSCGVYTFHRKMTLSEVASIVLVGIEKQFKRDGVFREVSAAKGYLTLQLYGHQQEVFACLFLDNQHQLITFEKMFYGTVDGAAVYPREVVKRALELNASAVIFAHNHPSGVPEPSTADRVLTTKLQEALDTVSIRTLDHFVVSANADVVSFAERGWI